MSKVDCLRCAQYYENKNPNVSRTKYGKIMTFPYSYDSNRKKVDLLGSEMQNI